MPHERPIDALVIGAGRAGTTSMYHHLRPVDAIQWSDIKEVNHFSIDPEYEKGEEHLHSFFKKGTGPVKCSSDTYLLPHPDAPERVYKHNPEAKMIVILRDPVERAYSSYHYGVNNGYHADTGFLAHLEWEKVHCPETEDIVTFSNHCHFHGSLYHRHLKRWLQYFPKDQFLVLRTADLASDPEMLYARVGHFLGIEGLETKVDLSQRVHNKGGEARSKSMQQVLANRNHWLRKALRGPIQPFKWMIVRSGLMETLKRANYGSEGYPPLDPDTRGKAMEFFKPDVEALYRDFLVSFEEMEQAQP